MLTSLVLSSAGFDRPGAGALSDSAEWARGRVLRRTAGGPKGQPYYAYIPNSAGERPQLMVSVHGVSRNADEHARLLAPMAERYGVVLVAPLFNRKQFPDYQRLGRSGKGPRADLALDRIVGEVLYHTGASSRCLYLFGYSGGGQFAHRYAMAHPERVGGVVIGAAGWYTFPDSKVSYPRGIGRVSSLPGVRFDAGRFLRVPMSVIIGERDCLRDPELNKSVRIDDQQGLNRLVRARNWVVAMNGAARAHGYPGDSRLVVMPGVEHSFEQGIAVGRLGEIIFTSLFDGRNARFVRENRVASGGI